MCLILFALNEHPKYRLILAANRDEFFNRPTDFADFWQENNQILGGRDKNSRGTWLGLNTNGRFCAITNYRDPKIYQKAEKSRGILSKKFLNSLGNTQSFIEEVSPEKEHYSGFNLLLSDNGFGKLFHYSNITDDTTTIREGIHGLSNHLLDTTWPKVEVGLEKLSSVMSSNSIDEQDLIRLLLDDQTAPDGLLPDTGISYDLEKKLSPVFISMKEYGTRSSTAYARRS